MICEELECSKHAPTLQSLVSKAVELQYLRANFRGQFLKIFKFFCESSSLLPMLMIFWTIGQSILVTAQSYIENDCYETTKGASNRIDFLTTDPAKRQKICTFPHGTYALCTEQELVSS